MHDAIDVAVMNQAAHRAMTLYRNTDHALPLPATPDEKVLVTGYGVTTGANLSNDVAAKGVQVQHVYTGSAPSEAAIDAAVAAAKTVDHVVVISNYAWNDPGQRELASFGYQPASMVADHRAAGHRHARRRAGHRSGRACTTDPGGTTDPHPGASTA